MFVPLWSLMAEIVFYFLSALSHTSRTQTCSCLYFVVLTAKMSPVQFGGEGVLLAVLWIVFSVPIDIALLIFSCCILL